ncbi:MAG: transcription termination factor Rho [Acidimicrobiaceae bacterium]|nr:transcription termination factor Rho [Acidimicrobiaceae bacterium]
MSTQPTVNRESLQGKTREDLVAMATAVGAAIPARATKAALIDSISAVAGGGSATSAPSAKPSRAVRSRRTVATPPDDFDSLIEEFAAEAAPAPAKAPATVPTPVEQSTPAPSAAPATEESRDERGNSERPSRPTPTNGGRQNRDFANDSNGRKSRNRRNRNGRERFAEALPNADQPYSGDLIEVEGLLDLRDDGYGFLRARGYHASPSDVYVSINTVRRFNLRKGDSVKGAFRPAASNEKYPALLRVDTVAGFDPEIAKMRPRFEDLTPLFPDEKLRLESDTKSELTPRIVDLLAPIGKGQRGLIVSPPKAGKTTIMKQIAQSIEANNPEVHLIVLLVDERPEEVTDMRRSVSGEVVASTFDRPAEEHTHAAELVIERAKRLVEQGRDVVIILDGITRLARAYNLAAPATGRIMSGGVDSGALYPPKKFFGAARNIEEGGSLTILASALVETGSKMDEVIFEEFKGTGNMELKLDRRLAERRLFPAIDVNASSTRHEELLFAREALPQVWRLRRVLNGLSNEGREAAGLELLIDKLKSTRSNDEFLAEIARGPAPTS